MHTFRKFSAVLAIVATAIGIGGFAIAHQASANTDNPHDSLIERIANRFNLNKSDVENVFNQERESRQAEHEARLKEQLAQAVTDGKITEAQKTLILEKHEELQAARESERETWQNMTREERRAGMQKQHNELEAWLQANNIPDDIFPIFGQREGHGGPGQGSSMRQGRNF